MKNDDKKRRCDAFDRDLNDGSRWEAYEKSKSLRWFEFADWFFEEYSIRPSRNAIYRWQKFMRASEGEHRLEICIGSRREIKTLADAGGLDSETADAYMALANNAILSGDPEKAGKIVDAAVKIHAASVNRISSKDKLEQGAKRLKLAKEALELQREKFEAQEKRLAEAAGAVSDDSLTESERLEKIKSIFGI